MLPFIDLNRLAPASRAPLPELPPPSDWFDPQRSYQPAIDGFPLQPASLSGPRNQLPGGAIDLGIDHLPSPFFSTPIHDLNSYNRLDGMTGPYGGTDPRFFGGGVNMPSWGQPYEPPSFASRFNAVNEQPFTPLFGDSFDSRFNAVNLNTGGDPFASRFNALSEQPFASLPGDPFAAEQAHREAGNPWVPQGLTDQARVDTFDDRFGNWEQPDTFDQRFGQFQVRSQQPQTASFMNYDPTPSVFDNTPWLASGGMTSNPASFGLHTSGATPDWARMAPGPAPLFHGPTPQPYGGVGPMFGSGSVGSPGLPPIFVPGMGYL